LAVVGQSHDELHNRAKIAQTPNQNKSDPQELSTQISTRLFKQADET